MTEYWIREADPNWMEEDVTIPDSVVEDDDAVVATSVTAVNSMSVLEEANYEEEIV